MYKSFLSWRYLLRRPVNLIGIVGILVGVGALILILSIMSGFLEETRKTVRGSLADLDHRAQRRPAPRRPRRCPRSPRASWRSCAPTRASRAPARSSSWFGILAPAGADGEISHRQLFDPQNASRAGVQLYGIDPADEFQTTELAHGAGARSRASGHARVRRSRSALRSAAGIRARRPAARTACSSASSWPRPSSLRRGSVINVVTANPRPEDEEFKPSNRHFVVAGTFRSKDNETDLGRIYLDRRELMDLLGPPRQFSQVLVKLKDYAQRRASGARRALASSSTAPGLTRRLPRTRCAPGRSSSRRCSARSSNERVLMAIMLSLVLSWPASRSSRSSR